MNEITFPTQSNATIIKASIIALIVATTIFVTIILPAEYKIDITGSGKSLGLTALTGDTPVEPVPPTTQKQLAGYQENQATIIVPPNKGVWEHSPSLGTPPRRRF